MKADEQRRREGSTKARRQHGVSSVDSRAEIVSGVDEAKGKEGRSSEAARGLGGCSE